MAEPTPIKSIFLEALFVVLGVVLAFGVNEWREHRNLQAKAEMARQSIHDEIQGNHDLVISSRDYHGLLVNRIYQYQEQLAVFQRGDGPRPAPLTFADFSEGFVRPAAVLSTAWTMAQQTDALSPMPYEEVLRLATIYAEQDRYELQAQTVGQVIYNGLAERGRFGFLERYAQMSDIIASLWFKENELAQAYAAFLNDQHPAEGTENSAEAAADTTGAPPAE